MANYPGFGEEPLFDEALASVEIGEGLEGYTDEELVELIGHCERNMQLVWAIDVEGQPVAMVPEGYQDYRMVFHAIMTERESRDW